MSVKQAQNSKDVLIHEKFERSFMAHQPIEGDNAFVHSGRFYFISLFLSLLVEVFFPLCRLKCPTFFKLRSTEVIAYVPNRFMFIKWTNEINDCEIDAPLSTISLTSCHFHHWSKHSIHRDSLGHHSTVPSRIVFRMSKPDAEKRDHNQWPCNEFQCDLL